ncbi:glycosyltransferase [Planktothricoides sp. SR001]|uniref:glycosyltransferase family 2 protein n=1 Tax=Planktothricoides sp. SR001 TaxID=1705388 RepID=UPI0006C89F55|nr:glycosyltransferase [Planktothricoides sp. SR001]
MTETNDEYSQPDSDNHKDYPLVSVIMNCYNGEKYLKEAIDSVMAQTYQNWELIFWDNQSTDSSAEICQSYNDSRIHYFYAPQHTTLGHARSLAIEKTQGDWIAFLDCDDLWLPDKLEKQVKIINEETYELGLIYGRAKVKIETSGLVESPFTLQVKFSQSTLPSGYKLLPEGRIFEKLAYRSFVLISTALINKSFYLKVGGISEKYKQSEDYDIFLKISAIAKVRALNDICTVYRVHGTNISHCQTEESYIEFIDILQQFSHHTIYPKAIRAANTNYAIYLLSQKQWKRGVYKLLLKSDIPSLVIQIFNKLYRYIFPT